MREIYEEVREGNRGTGMIRRVKAIFHSSFSVAV